MPELPSRGRAVGRVLAAVWLAWWLTPGQSLAGAEHHRYLETTGSRAVAYDWSVERRANELHIIAREPDRQFLTVCDADGATARWRIDDGHLVVEARREGDRLLLRGRRDGQAFAKEYALDAAPWFQAMSFSLRTWLAGDAGRIVFWTLRPDTLEPVKLQATRRSAQRIDTRSDGRVEATHVQVRAHGVLAALWKADYWFRATDGVFLKYRAVNGLPGTAETVIERLPASGTATQKPAAAL